MCSSDQKILSFDLSPDLSISDLKDFINAESNIPQASQLLFLNGTPVQGDDKTLEKAGIKDGDMLAMSMRQPEQENNMGSRRRQQNAQRPPPGDKAQEIEQLRSSILANPSAMAQMRDRRPDLAEAINDPNRFREVFLQMEREKENLENEKLEQMQLLNDDPFNVEAQKKIEEIIRQERVQENLQQAYEYTPEGQFISIRSLFGVSLTRNVQYSPV